MDNVAAGLKQGTDYVSVVSADNYGNGVVSGHLMAKALCGKGKIATVFHGADFFVTKQRHEGFVNTIKSDYPDIQIVDEKGIDGADFATLAQDATNAILAKNQDLQGIWAVWDTPAEGVLAAINSNNRKGVIVITEDLGKPVAIEMAKIGQVRGLGAQRPYEAGITEADLAAYGLLGKTAPDYVALPALAVDHDNVLQSWKDVYFQEAPADIANAFKD
jgi:ribose transport system substrate-binding protein